MSDIKQLNKQLFKAIKNPIEIKNLLKKGADVNAKNIAGNSIIHVAVKNGTIPVVKALIENGADIYLLDQHGWNLLEIVIRRKRITLIKMFINKFDVNTIKINRKNVIEYSIYHKYFELTELLIRSGKIDLNIQDDVGNTLLHKIIEHNNFKLTELLVKSGANVDIQNINGVSPLFFACNSLSYFYPNLINDYFNEKLKIIEILSKASSNIDLKDNENNTPLYIVCKYKIFLFTPILEKIVEILLQYGADINIECENGISPLSFIEKTSCDKILQLFLNTKKHS